jgi:hypothetical protein
MPVRKLEGTTKLPPPWQPTVAEPADAHAIRALMAGTATAEQQGRVVRWLHAATGLGELEFRPESERASAFASGKRFVGIQFWGLAVHFEEKP